MHLDRPLLLLRARGGGAAAGGGFIDKILMR